MLINMLQSSHVQQEQSQNVLIGPCTCCVLSVRFSDNLVHECDAVRQPALICQRSHDLSEAGSKWYLCRGGDNLGVGGF